MKSLTSIIFTLGLLMTSVSSATASKELAEPVENYVVKVNTESVTILEETYPLILPMNFVGTGVIFGNYIVTNNHVVQGFNKVSFIDNSGQNIPASLVGANSCDDLAVFKISSDKISKPRLTFTNNISPEDTITSFGHAVDGKELEKIKLTVSSTFSNILANNVINLNGYIKQGFSGGPAFKENKLIGINFANNSATNKSYIIPMYKVEKMIAELESGTNIFQGGISGIFVKERKTGIYGTIVTSVLPGTPASKTELKVGDVITEYQNIPISPGYTTCTDTTKTNSISIKGFKSNTTTPFNYTITK